MKQISFAEMCPGAVDMFHWAKQILSIVLQGWTPVPLGVPLQTRGSWGSPLAEICSGILTWSIPLQTVKRGQMLLGFRA